MTYQSDLPIKYVVKGKQAKKDVEAFGSGYVPRNFEADPVGRLIPAFGGQVYKRKDWPELMRLQDKNKTSPLDWHMDCVEIYDQRNLPYCWMYGTVAGVATQYAKTGIKTPRFSPTSTAAMVKKFKAEGGWATEACNGISKFGIATLDVWPNVSMNKTLPAMSYVRENMHQHDLIEFEDFGVNNFDAAMSVLLDPLHSAPVTGGYMWWGHLIILLKAIRVDDQWGVIFANSWGKDWGEQGYGILLGDKAIPYESVRIGSVKPRRTKR